MNIKDELFVEVIEILLTNKVEFLIIVGYAVNYYGYGRYTGDIDFWLRPSNDNKIKFVGVLKILSNNSKLINYANSLDFTKKQTIQIGKVPHRMDFLTKVSSVEFDEAWKRKNCFI